MLNPPPLKNNTTNVVIQQNSRKFLMMDILMSETCWAHKKWNKIASDIKLVFYSPTITMMHGPINIRFLSTYQAPNLSVYPAPPSPPPPSLQSSSWTFFPYSLHFALFSLLLWDAGSFNLISLIDLNALLMQRSAFISFTFTCTLI